LNDRASLPPIVPLQDEWLSRGGRLGTGVFWTLTVVCSLVAAAPVMAGWGFLFDIAANLSYFAAVPLFLLGIVAAVTRRFAITAFAMAAVIAIAVFLASQSDWAAPPGPPAEQIKVLVCNLEAKADAWLRLREVIEDRQPDVVGLVEVEREVVEAITQDAALAERYPFRISPQGGFAWTRVVLSRHPFEFVPPDADRDRYKNMYALWRSAIVTAPQGTFVFIVEHFPSPRNELSWSLGNKTLSLLAELVHTQLRAPGVPILIAGDFNTTPTGYRHRIFRIASGFRADPLGFPPQGTWPSVMPRFCSLPLDRAWCSEEIRISKREVLDSVGSDHRPIMVTFHIAK